MKEDFITVSIGENNQEKHCKTTIHEKVTVKLVEIGEMQPCNPTEGLPDSHFRLLTWEFLNNGKEYSDDNFDFSNVETEQNNRVSVTILENQDRTIWERVEKYIKKYCEEAIKETSNGDEIKIFIPKQESATFKETLSNIIYVTDKHRRKDSNGNIIKKVTDGKDAIFDTNTTWAFDYQIKNLNRFIRNMSRRFIFDTVNANTEDTQKNSDDLNDLAEKTQNSEPKRVARTN